MTIIEALRVWLRRYEPLSAGRLAIDFLPKQARTYSVDSVPCKEEIKRYMDGSSLRQFLFTLSSREFKGEDIRQNADNLAFYEAFSNWVLQQNQLRKLPELADGRTARKIEVTTSGYPFQVDENGTSRYQIQLRMEYFQKGIR